MSSEPRPDRESVIPMFAEPAVASGDATGWFEKLYSAADKGEVEVPWADRRPSPLLTRWSRLDAVAAQGGTACVVGCGYGDDAEFLAALGFEVTAFDIAPTAVATARRRFPSSAVTYRADDAMAPSAELVGRFDFVVEIFTLQALPAEARRVAMSGIASLVAPGGLLLVVARARDEHDPPRALLPWPLTRSELDAFAASGLSIEQIEDFMDDEEPPVRRWRASFRRPPARS